MSTGVSDQQSEIVIYSSPFCGYCAAAKSLLQRKGVEYREIDILANPQARIEMIERTGRRTVPQVFIGSHHVGGFDDLSALDSEGKLDPLISYHKDQE